MSTVPMWCCPGSRATWQQPRRDRQWAAHQGIGEHGRKGEVDACTLWGRRARVFEAGSPNRRQQTGASLPSRTRPGGGQFSGRGVAQAARPRSSGWRRCAHGVGPARRCGPRHAWRGRPARRHGPFTRSGSDRSRCPAGVARRHGRVAADRDPTRICCQRGHAGGGTGP